MLMYGYVAKWKKRVTVGFALFSVNWGVCCPLFVDEPLGKPLVFSPFWCALSRLRWSLLALM